MATITETETRPGASIAETGQRFLLHNVGWQGYETMLRLIGDRPIRLTYEPCTASPAFPFLPLEDVVRLLKQGATMNQSRWGRIVRAWVRDELAPRYHRKPGDPGPA